MAVRLLLIEDNPGDALIFREKLADSDLDFELVHAKRLEDGCDLVREGDFDIILVDLSLPDASGLEAVVRVVKVAEGTPVVVLTGLDDASMAAQARHEGAIDYLVKWYQDGSTMARYIRYAIEQRRTRPGEPGQPEQEVHLEDEAPGREEQGQVPAPPPAEREPSSSDDPLRAALDPCPDGIVVAFADGTVEYANRRAAGWIGDGGSYPWPLRTGRSQVSVGDQSLVQEATRTHWQGKEAFAVTLRAASAGGGDADGSLFEAAEASVAFLAQSERRVRWIAGVLRNALDLEQLVRSDTKPSPSVLDVVDALSVVIRELRPIALERGMPINIRASREKIPTTVDRQLLEAILRRVLMDSLLTASGDSVEVEVQIMGGDPRVTIEWEMSLTDWAALPESARGLSRRVLEGLMHRAGGHCLFEQDGSRDVVTLILPPSS